MHPRLDSAEDEPVVSGEKPVIVKVLDDVPLSATKASFLDKLRDVPPLLKYIVPLTLVYFFEYFINQGLVSGAWSVLGRGLYSVRLATSSVTVFAIFCFFVPQYELIHYESAGVDHDFQYTVFQMVYQVGVFISRSSGSYIHIEKIWVLAALQVRRPARPLAAWHWSSCNSVTLCLRLSRAST